MMTEDHFFARDIRISAIATLCFVILGVNPALAQTDASATQDQWEYSAAIYLWGADISGHTVRGSEVVVRISDLVDNLERTFMGAFATCQLNERPRKTPVYYSRAEKFCECVASTD
jgi:hypothetical protein